MKVQKPYQQGTSLVAVMMAMAVFSILAYAVTSQFNYMLKGTSVIRERANRENLKNYLRAKVDCVTTFSQAGATCVGVQNLYTINNRVLIPGADESKVRRHPTRGTRIGKYELIAKCEFGHNPQSPNQHLKMILVKYRQADSSDEFTPLFKDIQLCQQVL